MTFRPNQDNIYQEVKLFIEGVQVPFQSIQINQGIGTLPTASISIPPFPGLMDICRYYQPKVHIFYVDAYEDDEEDAEKVLFMGHIQSVSYSRSRQNGNVSISFSCAHKNALMNDILVDYNHPMQNTVINGGVRNDGAQQMFTFSSEHSIQMALRGIERDPPEGNLAIEIANAEALSVDETKADPAILASGWKDEGFENRYLGFPGVLMNLWNQFKRSAIIREEDFESLLMYSRLAEDGIQFFDRLSGHYFIEKAMDDGKIDPCPEDSSGKAAKKILVPPAMRLFVQSAVQTDMSIKLMQQALNFSGELTSFLTIYQTLLQRIDYELLTLASPVEGNRDPLKEFTEENSAAIETIIKPQLPFYYAPNCNVYYPYMYHTLSVNQDEAGVPTRITYTSSVMPTGNNTLHKNYRAPASIREAIVKGYENDERMKADQKKEGSTAQKKETTEAEIKNLYKNANLLMSTDGIKNRTRVGTYEWGRGVKHKRYEMPFWLSLYSNSTATSESQKEVTSTDPQDLINLNLLRRAWEYRYGADKNHLNPYDPSSQILPHERLLFASADYRFTMEVAGSKAGSLEGVFNPYIIPGYPMDILDPSPVNPSFHAMCTSVTHTITSNSISTSVSFVAAITYSELSNYHLMFVNPWLQIKLGIVSGVGEPTNSVDTEAGPAPQTVDVIYSSYTSSILNNATAKKIAEEEFYLPTLKVGALAPEDLYNFEDGTLKPISISTEVETGEMRELNPMLSVQGNLLLVSRPIESRKDVEERFGYTFIDMEDSNYNPNIIKYSDRVLAEHKLLEPGASQFLSYSEIPDEDEPDELYIPPDP